LRHNLLLPLVLTANLWPSALRAEEGAGGHYMPGATATFIDALPGKPAFVIADAFTYYNGSAGASQPLEFGGLLTLNGHATAYADTLLGLYETPLRLLGGNYVAGLLIPYVWMEVDGQVQRTGPLGGTQTISVHDTANGIGDLLLYPFMLGWTDALDLKYDVRLGIYAPTGPYDIGRLANTGRNYWTFEPSASLSWLSTKIGTEISLFAGFDINTKNNATDYQSGEVFHLEGTLAQHLPLLRGFIGGGANGFYYQQISGDSGSGATLGGFEGRTVGVGPVVSYGHKVGKVDFAAEVKWLPELEVEKRLKGDYVWVKVGVVF
jgi:hypothetical protein